jgi:hypothetical protein
MLNLLGSVCVEIGEHGARDAACSLTLRSKYSPVVLARNAPRLLSKPPVTGRS